MPYAPSGSNRNKEEKERDDHAVIIISHVSGLLDIVSRHIETSLIIPHIVIFLLSAWPRGQ
jgi:hypothetical protein